MLLPLVFHGANPDSICRTNSRYKKVFSRVNCFLHSDYSGMADEQIVKHTKAKIIFPLLHLPRSYF